MITPAVYRAKNTRNATFAVLANDGRPITRTPRRRPSRAIGTLQAAASRERYGRRPLRSTPALPAAARLDRAPARRQRPQRSLCTTNRESHGHRKCQPSGQGEQCYEAPFPCVFEHAARTGTCCEPDFCRNDAGTVIDHHAPRQSVGRSGLPMLTRLLTRAAPPVVTLSVIALIPTVALLARLGLLTDPMVLGSFVLVLGFLAVGLVTTVRRVGNPIGWLLLWQGVVAGISLLSAAYGMYDLEVAAEPLPGGSLLLWTSSWIWLASLAVSPVIHVLFPDGRLLSRRWAGVIWLALASMALAMAAIAVAAWPLPGPALLEGPSWGPELDPPPPLALVGLALFGVAEAASLTAMAIRLRGAKGDEREQIKWFLYAGSFVILGITVEVVLGVPITIASWLGGMVVPFAIAVALFKYRLYDIDRLINRTLVYGLLTALLGSIYAVAVLVLGQVFGGVASNPPSWAVAGITLAVASLFQPARRRIQAVVDRRFNRRKYDAGKTIEAFSVRLRDELDLDALSVELLSAVDLTVSPTNASLWLRPPEPSAPSQGSSR